MKKFIMFFCAFALVLTGCATSSQKLLVKASKNLTEYDINMTLENTSTLTCTQNVEYVNNTDSKLKNICFHLYPNAFKQTAINKPISTLNAQKCYYNGFSEGAISIDKAYINSAVAPITYLGDDKDILVLDFAHNLSPDDTATIKLEYSVTIPNCNHRFGYGENALNLANFYPIVCAYSSNWVTDGYHYNGDPFNSEVANYNVEVTYPSSLVVAHTGNVVEHKSKGDTSTSTIQAKVVRDFALVFSNKFEVISKLVDNVKVNYYYYDDLTPESNLQVGVDAIKTFNELFGEYPYKEYSIVKTNFVHGGMEYPNMSLISDMVTDNMDYQNVIVHETAHQWWYGMVGNDEYSYGWLDEGLTEYSTALFYEKNTNYGVDKTKLMDNISTNYRNFCNVYTQIAGSVNTKMNRKLNEFNSETEYVYIAYVKGNMFFDNLRQVVGDKKFFKSLQTYLSDNQFKLITPSHLLGAFQRACKTDLSGYFDSWIEGKMIVK